MYKKVENGMSQQAIVNEARNNGATWVVVYHDHYRGNTPGYYQSLESFESSTHFGWHVCPDDRKATLVYITDEDVPGMVDARYEMVNNLRKASFNADKAECEVLSEMGGMKNIDGRWGINNPKRIEAETFNKNLKAEMKKAAEPFVREADELREKLAVETFISGNLIEINF